MNARVLDQILLGAVVAAALASLGWGGAQELTHRRAPRPTAGLAKPAGANYLPGELPATADEPEEWLPPVALPRGPGWVYELFTPPEIRYDANLRQFTVVPPGDPPGTQATGIELVAVKREPFRLQLLGYVGGDGDCRGTFENRLTTGVFLAGARRAVPELGLAITDFRVEHRWVKLPDGRSSRQRVATAVVRDERTGVEINLTAGELACTEELRAVLATKEAETETMQEVREGEEIESADRSYRIERIQLEPPTAELSQISAASPQLIRLTLIPDRPAGGLTAAASN